MKRDLLKEIEVDSVGALRKALEGVSDETPVLDIFGAAILLATYREAGTKDIYIEVA